MKIKLYKDYRRPPLVTEVSDEECAIWEEKDYQRRLAAAKDPSSVRRRTTQQILDEEVNRPTFNNDQKERRRHESWEECVAHGHNPACKNNVEDMVFNTDADEDLHHAISKLTPKQQDMVKKVYWENCKQVDIARAEGVSEAAIAQRMATTHARLKKFWAEKK